MKFQNYIRPETVPEALSWAQKPGTVILGGMMWLHLQGRTVENAVDLSLLGLDRIEQTPQGVRIGAYVTLRQAEVDPLLNAYTHGAIRTALAPIVGVQFRNTATVGGSVFGRFGFSDVTALFCALGASVCLAGQGTTPMEQFVRDGAQKDLLTHILLPIKTPDGVCTLAQRNAATDFPVLTLTACRREDKLRVTLSPAPLRAETVDCFMQDIANLPKELADKLAFRSDNLGSAEYRRHLAKVLTKRALAQLGG